MNAFLTENDKSKCCGCAVCSLVCPKQCIDMEYDSEGFAFPAVNSEQCIECNKCAAVCPMEEQSKKNTQFDTAAFAAHTKNKKILSASSSGGVFSELATEIILHGGVVCGATIDEKHKVKHIIIDSLEDLPKLQGSKYVQSDLSGCLSEIKSILKTGTKILFVGTPCQVSAVKNAFDCENLITVDLLCHGVPSQKLFDSYIDYLEKKHNGKLTEIVFRDKEKFGWSITQRYKIRKRNTEKTYYLERHTSEYFSGFLRNMTQRYSCFNCPYTTLERVGDITLADFWGVDKVRPEFLNADGTSLVLTNSQRGKELLFGLKDQIVLNEVSLSDATYQNVNFISPPEKNQIRDKIYNIIFTLGYKKSGKKYLLPKNSYKYKIAQILNINMMKRSFTRGRKN